MATVSDTFTINVGTDERPLLVAFSLAILAEKGEADTFLAGCIRNRIRDKRGTTKGATYPEGASPEEIAACDKVWHEAAIARLKAWEVEGVREGGGGVTLTPFVKVARMQLEQAWPKGKDARVNGKTLKEVKAMGEESLRTYLGPKVAKAFDAIVKRTPSVNLAELGGEE